MTTKQAEPLCVICKQPFKADNIYSEHEGCIRQLIRRMLEIDPLQKSESVVQYT